MTASPEVLFPFRTSGPLVLADFFLFSDYRTLFSFRTSGPYFIWGPTKNWPKTDFQWKLHTNRVFYFQDTLSLCFILFSWFILSKNMCKHTLTHIIAKKCNFAWKNSEKIAKNHDFGDFWWFSCFWHDVTYDVTQWRHTRYVCTFFGTNGLGRVIAIHWH